MALSSENAEQVEHDHSRHADHALTTATMVPPQLRSYQDRQCGSYDLPVSFPVFAGAGPSLAAVPLTAALLQRPLNSVRSDPNIKINLESEELWREFHQLGTEMIITKLGRRMFPTLKATLSGLDENAKYYVLLDLTLADDSRFRFSSGWVRSGKAEPQWPSRIYVHPDSPATGAQWMKHQVSFQKVKLTNNTMDQQGHLVLTSMHKYVPRIHVIPASDYASLHWHCLPVTVNTATFSVCDFIAVTAYANERMTQLKIDNNPFAKGFRENGQLRVKKRQLIERHDEIQRKKQRPDSSASSHSSTNNNTDDDTPSTAGVETPPPAPTTTKTKSPTNFSIARLVGDKTTAADQLDVKPHHHQTLSAFVAAPQFPWLGHHYANPASAASSAAAHINAAYASAIFSPRFNPSWALPFMSPFVSPVLQPLPAAFGQPISPPM